MPDHLTLDLVDADEAVRGDTRRDVFKKLAAGGTVVTGGLLLGGLPSVALGQSAQQDGEILNFALLLEYLESDFYTRGLAAPGMIPAADLTIFNTISAHESSHVSVLRTIIAAKGATPIVKPVFDFTAKGSVAGFAFTAAQYETFKMLAQAFEDLGVRAYKGQAPRLIADKATLNTALTIHSVEARHASEIRRLRGKKGWITGSGRDDLPAFTQPIYAGDENVTQGSVSLATISTGFGGVEGASEAFDEPLSKEQVTAIVTPFLA
jgi:hypothetical protein